MVHACVIKGTIDFFCDSLKESPDLLVFTFNSNDFSKDCVIVRQLSQNNVKGFKKKKKKVFNIKTAFFKYFTREYHTAYKI